MIGRGLVSSCAVLACVLAAAPAAHAQEFPAKTVRIIVPFPPGGGTDFVVRTIAARAFENSGYQVIIDNRAGAAGNLGTAVGAKAAPDGYTLTVAYMGTLAIAPWLYKDVGFRPLQDFSFITQLVAVPLVAVSHPSLPAKTLKEVAALASEQPGQISVATAGDTSQMTGELFQLMTKTKITPVPYRGAGPAVSDLLGGHIPLGFLGLAATTEHIKSGKLRGLAVTQRTRLASLPDVPSAVEAGYPEFEVSDWYGLAAPVGTPPDIIAKINAEFIRVLRLPEVKERLNKAGFETAGSTPENFTGYVKSEYERWGRVVKQAGIEAK